MVHRADVLFGRSYRNDFRAGFAGFGGASVEHSEQCYCIFRSRWRRIVFGSGNAAYFIPLEVVVFINCVLCHCIRLGDFCTEAVFGSGI